MSLSLEVRKFINSKHTGEYVDVALPRVLRSKREDAREAQKDSDVAESAKRKVKELASAKSNAEKVFKSAQDAVKKTTAELARAEKELADLEKREKDSLPHYNEKQAVFEKIKKEFSEKRAAMDKLNYEYSLAEEERKRAEQILKAATASTEAPNSRQREELEHKLSMATDNAASKKILFDDASVAALEIEKTFKINKNEFDDVESRMKSLKSEVAVANTAKNTLSDKLSKLIEREQAASERLNKLISDCENADKELSKLKKSARSVETKNEIVRFHYMEAGKGEPIVLVHSAGQSLFTFNKIFYKLSMNYRVIALDLAGHGYSDRPAHFDYSISDHAESLSRFMDALGIETAHFLGYSMGAGFVLELARKHPERVDKLVLLSPGGVTAEMPFSIRMLESGLFGPFGGRIFSPKSVAKLLDNCVFDHTVVKDHDIEQYSQPFINSDVRYCTRRTVNAFNEEEVISGLRDVEAETLILWSEEDKWHPIEAKDLYLAALKNSQFALVRNSGHLMQEERPDRVCELVKKFIPAGYEIDS